MYKDSPLLVNKAHVVSGLPLDEFDTRIKSYTPEVERRIAELKARMDALTVSNLYRHDKLR